MAAGAELQIELADVDVQNLTLSGSLLISGDEELASCQLQNVTVENRGINRELTQEYWKNRLIRDEFLEIIFEGRGAFIAEDVTFHGNLRILVPDGACVHALQDHGRLIFQEEKLHGHPWRWGYDFGDHSEVVLQKKSDENRRFF